jgi:POT family proton-dependent oligopeptide transporter
MGSVIPASYFQSINAIAIVLLAPLSVGLWSMLAKRNAEPASPYKQALGLMLLAMGYLVIALGVKGMEPGVKVSMMWLVSLYSIHTLGELCLSPIGLSMVNKLAPVKFASLLMGVWFLSTSAANKFAGDLSRLYPEPVVAVSTVEALETERSVALFPKGYVKETQKVGGVPVIPTELVNLAGIEDTTVRTDLRKRVEASLVPNDKAFLGFKISNLYDFFMLFVFMAGASSILLALISKKLLTMMHGVR